MKNTSRHYKLVRRELEEIKKNVKHKNKDSEERLAEANKQIS